MNIEELVNQNYRHFSESDRAVWAYLSEHRSECADMAIKKMAQKCCPLSASYSQYTQTRTPLSDIK